MCSYAQIAMKGLVLIMKIAVVGASGQTGRHVLDFLRAQGVEIVPLSRKMGVDVTTGVGLDDALVGVNRIIDVSNIDTTEEEAATAFFTSEAEHVQRAGAKAGADRLIVLSIVGIDRLSSGYYVAKRRQEETARAGSIPTTILRATQFHEFAEQVIDWGRQGNTSNVQPMRVQPIAVREVARLLTELVLTKYQPIPLAEVGGPQVERLEDMADRLVKHRHDPVHVEPNHDESPEGRLLEEGALLPGPAALLMGPTFQQWLDAQPSK